MRAAVTELRLAGVFSHPSREGVRDGWDSRPRIFCPVNPGPEGPALFNSAEQGFDTKTLGQKAQIRIGAEICKVGENGFDLAVSEAKPTGKRAGVLLDRSRGNETSRTEVVSLIDTDDRIRSVHVSAIDCATHDEVMAAPAVVCDVAVAGKRTAKVGNGE